jgi:hypothetical protein
VNDLNEVVGTEIGQQFSTIQHHCECEGPTEQWASQCEELSNQEYTPCNIGKNEKCQLKKWKKLSVVVCNSVRCVVVRHGN